MKLIPVSDVRELLRLDAIDRIDAAIEACLDTATEQLSAQLRAKFDQVSTHDVFMVRGGLRFGVGVDTRYHYRFALTRGLLTTDVTFLRSGTLKGLDDATDALDEDHGVLVNRDKGSIFIDAGASLDGLFLKCSYTAGFDVDDVDDTLYAQDEVPDWLKSCALAYATVALLKSNPDLGGSNDKQPARDPKEMMAGARVIVEGHCRYFASITRPLNF